ncbi:hypothetical protein [Methanoculleus sp.]|jgi:hypothetical protein|uniref:hypothetical protein n=1 Tax=Methanoculleus sp. TaxID=90427 RepID=UPI0025CDE3FA|nr:hypothetical protein [Methanoculleus sp.]MCK9320284.1 hypothetical protein [Methanoculleus sp.]
MFEEIKYFIQRGKRGYSDRDTWDISEYLGEIMPELLRSLKRGSGCPSKFYDKGAVNNECHKWSEALETMAQGFEAAEWIKSSHPKIEIITKDGKREMSSDFKSLDQAEEKMKKGLHLFAENYLGLWD